MSSQLNASALPYKYRAHCPKCAIDFPNTPKFWDCPNCNQKTWQPDEQVNNCQVCNGVVAKFSRHHCRACGLVTCTACNAFTTLIPEWSATERQRVCKRCAVPSTPPSMTGYLQKLGARNALFGENFKSRYFELRGFSLLYSKAKGEDAFGQVDIEGAKIIDVAIHPNAFCLIGPKLQRGYVFSAETLQQKKDWIDAISNALKQNSKSGGGAEAVSKAAAAAQEDEDRTTDVIFGGEENNEAVGMRDFEVLTVLGLGSFGRVMKVRHKGSGDVLAMKVLDKQQIINNRMITHTQAEKSILQEIRHPFIVGLHYAFQTKRHLVLVLTFLCGGELFFHLQRAKRFNEQRARLYGAEIAMALEYIRGKNIIYRDLKPENLVLDRDGHVNLTDFGLAKRDVENMTHTFCGTPEYMAPELILRKGHTYAVDWWSLGVFLYEMVAGVPPFYAQNVHEMYDQILHKKITFPAHFSTKLNQLLLRLLERDVSKRISTLDELKEQPFFKELDFKKVYNREYRPEFVPDVAQNDLRYFDKQFLHADTKVAQLDQPNDPNDPSSKRFEGFNFSDSGSPTKGGGGSQSPRGGKKA